jgi:protein arginine N-methyltransferase 1
VKRWVAERKRLFDISPYKIMKKIVDLLLRLLLRIKFKIMAHPYIRQLYKNTYQVISNQEYFQKWFNQERMLADKFRMEVYSQAIHKYIKKDDIVLDLGTGTGIMSFFAAMRHPKKIYAIDHSDIIKMAKLIADHNDLSNIIFLKAHSKNVMIPEKVDVIVQEQMGAYLLNENMIESVIDLREKYLKANGKIIPARFELYIEPAQLNTESRIPFLWEHEIQSINYAFLKSYHKETPDYFYRELKNQEVDFFLCQPEPIFAFDLEVMQQNDLPNIFHYRRKVVKSGCLDGFCFFFRAIVDNEISLTTSPLSERRAYHWPNLFYRVESKIYHVDDVIQFTLNMGNVLDRNTWIWSY